MYKSIRMAEPRYVRSALLSPLSNAHPLFSSSLCRRTRWSARQTTWRSRPSAASRTRSASTIGRSDASSSSEPQQFHVRPTPSNLAVASQVPVGLPPILGRVVRGDLVEPQELEQVPAAAALRPTRGPHLQPIGRRVVRHHFVRTAQPVLTNSQLTLRERPGSSRARIADCRRLTTSRRTRSLPRSTGLG